jgi:hypothetical protein
MKYRLNRLLCWSELKRFRQLHQWLSTNSLVEYAFRIAANPAYLTPADALMLHSLGVAWTRDHGEAQSAPKRFPKEEHAMLASLPPRSLHAYVAVLIRRALRFFQTPTPPRGTCASCVSQKKSESKRFLSNAES